MAKVFRDVSVVDADTEPRHHLDVVVEDGLIAAIEPTGGLRNGDEVVVERGFVAPGVVDGHVHFDDNAVELNEIMAMHYMARGVTGVVCMDGSPAILRLRDDIAAGRVTGPRIWTTGPIHNESGMTYDGGRAHASAEAAAGYDAIKVYNYLSRAGFDGLNDGAREAELPVVGHVVGDVGMASTLQSGQIHIVHLEEILYASLGVDMSRLVGPEPVDIDPDQVAAVAMQFKERRLTVGTTIDVLASAHQQLRNAALWCNRPDVIQLPRLLRKEWTPPSNFYANKFTSPRHVDAFARLVRLTGQLAQGLSDAGVRLVAGSDAMVSGVSPGTSMRRELRHLIRAGLSNADALTAAMGVPLTDADVAPRHVDVGAPADLIALPGDPFQSVTYLDGLRGVMAVGHWQLVRDIKHEIKHATARLDDERHAAANQPLHRR